MDSTAPGILIVFFSFFFFFSSSFFLSFCVYLFLGFSLIFLLLSSHLSAFYMGTKWMVIIR